MNEYLDPQKESLSHKEQEIEKSLRQKSFEDFTGQK